MNKKDLIDLGIAEDVAEKIVVLHGKDIESHKTKITELQGQFDTANTQLTDANKQIEDFKGMDIEGVKKSADEYRANFEKLQTESAAQLANLKFDHALQSALTSAKAKNPKAVTALLSRDALKLNDDGSILGLKEQLETIQKDNDYLFTSETPEPRIVAGGNSQSVIGDAMTNAARKAAGLTTEQK